MMKTTSNTNEPAGSPEPGKVSVPIEELRFKAVRSQGPGGQHVNKTATKIQVEWDYMQSERLTLDQKTALARDPKIQARTNREGVLVVHAQSERSQLQNKRSAIAKLQALVDDALAEKLERIETKPPASQRRERLESKRRQSDRKRQRRWSGDE